MKTWLLKVFAITFIIFISHTFIINKTMASQASPSIGFNINESISEAKYLKWKIKATEPYQVMVQLEDRYGKTVNISFSPDDDSDQVDYEVDEEVDYLFVTLPVDNNTCESDSFEDLINFFLSEDDDSTFKLTDNAKIKRIQISGIDFKLYSITLADNNNFDDPCWAKDAADWDNLNDYYSDGGDASFINSVTYIQFYSSYIHVATVTRNSTPYSPVYFPGYTSGYGMYGYPYSGYPNYSPNYGGYPNYYPDRYAVPVNSQNPYGAYTILPTSYSGYYGNPYNPSNPLYGTVPRPNLSLPSGIMNMMLSSNWDTSQLGIQLGRPYIQSAITSGWSPWSSSYGFQPYYGYSGGYPWG